MRTFYLLLLSTLAAFCQLPVVPLQGFTSAANIPGPTNIFPTGAFRWWVASDMAVGITVSNQFLDRIIGAHMWQMDTSVSPTNSALGVRFNGGQSLTNIFFSMGNIAAAGGETDFEFLIFNYTTPSAPTRAISAASDGRGILVTTANNLAYAGTQSGGPNNVVALPHDVLVDVGVVYTATTTTWYTNGVPAKTNTPASADTYSKSFWGNSGAPSFEGPLTGYIVEDFVLSNTVTTAANVAAMHAYRTNVYGGTP